MKQEWISLKLIGCIVSCRVATKTTFKTRPMWAYVSDSVQEIKQMQMLRTYWLEKVLKMISL